MALQDVLNKIKLDPGNSSAFNSKATQVLTNLYQSGGAEVKAMLDGIAVDAKQYLIQDGDNVAFASRGIDTNTNQETYYVEIDFDWVESELLYLSQSGTPVNFSAEAVLAHELMHLFNWESLDPAFSASNIFNKDNNRGPQVLMENTVQDALGQPQRTSYFSASTRANASSDINDKPTELNFGYDYTPSGIGSGHFDVIFVDAENILDANNQNIGPIFLTDFSQTDSFVVIFGDAENQVVGGSSGDYIHTGGGDDWVVSSGGIDYLDGGGNSAGGDVIDFRDVSNTITLGLHPGTGLLGDTIFTAQKDEADKDFFTDFENIFLSDEADNPDTLFLDGSIEILEKLNQEQIRINGRLGDDLVNFTGLDGFEGQSGSAINLADGTAIITGGASGLILVGFESAIGTKRDDIVNGSEGANYLDGHVGHDDVSGQGGNDTLGGGTGADKVDGGDGNDLIATDAGSDWIVYVSGVDTVRAGSGNDYIDVTGAMEDTMVLVVEKGFGHDQIAGTSSRIDRVIFEGISSSDVELIWNWTSQTISNEVSMIGEAAIRVKSTGDTIYLPSLAGQYTNTRYGPDYPSMGHNFDLVFSDRTVSAGYWDYFFGFPWAIGKKPIPQDWKNALSDFNTERESPDDGQGSDSNDSVSGDDGDNNINSGNGDDLVTAGLGNDQVNTSGAGNDEYDGGGGTDTASFALASVAITVDLTAGTASGGSIGNDTLVNFEVVIGGTGADTLSGSAGGEALHGGAGNDLLEGRGGADTLTGDDGIDTVSYAGSSSGVSVNFNSGTASGGDATGDVLSRIENMTGSAFGDALVGDGGANLLNGGEGDDSLSGDGGNDTLNGAAGDDTLEGGNGTDSLVGGAGNDLYVVDTSDVITELAGAGQDTVQTSASYTLGANIENLILMSLAAANGTGNALANALTGNTGSNQLSGLAGNDTLNGGGGNDTLDGGADADVMAGGTGNDLYVVDQLGDQLTELDGEGSDTVQGAVSYSLGANFEHLILTGSAALSGNGNTLANILTGNSGANLLAGLEGDDSLNGGAGDDTLDGGADADALAGGSGNDLYIVDSASDTVTELAAEGSDTVQSTVSYALSTNVENLTLTGSSISGTGNALANAITGNAGANLLAGLEGNDNLTGGEGADTLDGGLGADTLIGGAGDDLYIIDDDGEVVTELAADGVDLVQTSVSYTLGANIENLTMTGSAAIGGTGNALGNVIIGNTGGNALSGLGGNDSLAGGAGSDTLDGGAGGDTLKGGAGNDTYVVDVTTDVLIEVASGGDDLVRSVVTWTLGDELDDLTLTGSAAINGTGNALANTVTGNGAANSLSGGDGNDSLLGASGADTMAGGNGNDYLTGGAGIDTLNGGVGADRFVFNAKAEAGDRINGFVSADDAIRIDASAFGGGLTSGTGFTFASVTDDAGLATRAQDFIYNSTTGELWFNANGDAAGGLTKIALLAADPDFVKGDIILF